MANKFRFLIACTFLGNVRGTNDQAAAEDFADSEYDFVIDIETNEWIIRDENGEIRREQIPELPPVDSEEQGNESKE